MQPASPDQVVGYHILLTHSVWYGQVGFSTKKPCLLCKHSSKLGKESPLFNFLFYFIIVFIWSYVAINICEESFCFLQWNYLLWKNAQIVRNLVCSGVAFQHHSNVSHVSVRVVSIGVGYVLVNEPVTVIAVINVTYCRTAYLMQPVWWPLSKWYQLSFPNFVWHLNAECVQVLLYW